MQSLIVATDKKAGLYVYGMDGAVRHFVAAGRVNNVDLIDAGRHGVLVVASDRNDTAHAKLLVLRLDTQQATLKVLGTADGGAGEAYGVCLWRRGSVLHAFSVLKSGAITQVRLDLRSSGIHGTVERQFTMDSQSEGCVVDPRTQTLYVGEEARGVWAFNLNKAGTPPRRLVAAVDGQQLIADVEGLALAPEGRRGGWLVVSSQGDNSFALYRLPTLQPAGRFRISGGALGSVEETDGIALSLGSHGPGFEHGLFVAQDGVNAPAAQNFKLVPWERVLQAAGLPPSEEGPRAGGSRN